MTDRPRVLWHSAAAPKSAYLDALLLPLLQKEMTLQTEGGSDDRGLHCYQLEDHPASRPLAEQLLTRPGVVLFHDVLSPHAQREAIPDLPEQLLVRELRHARAVVCFNERNAHEARAAVGDTTPVYVVGYPVDPALAELPPPQFARPLQIAVVGSPGLEQRLHHLLAALVPYLSQVQVQWMVDSTRRADAAALLAEHGVDKVTLHSPLDAVQWRGLLKDTDCAFHLHASAFGDPGPYLEMSLAAGRLAVVSAFSGTDSLPADTVEKIVPGLDEPRQLARLFEQLLDPSQVGRYRQRAQNARRFAAARHAAPEVAAELIYLFRRFSRA